MACIYEQNGYIAKAKTLSATCCCSSKCSFDRVPETGVGVEGTILGDLVGAVVGKEVGDVVGEEVGAVVGEGVGDGVPAGAGLDWLLTGRHCQ